MSTATKPTHSPASPAIPTRKPSPHGQLLEVHAREKAGMSEDWLVYDWRCMPPSNNPTLYYALTGAVTPLIRVGKRKGRPNWRKLDKATVREIIITPTEHAAWVAVWEAQTGQCRECMGEGKTVASVSVKDGTEWRECRGCGGDGKAKGVAR